MTDQPTGHMDRNWVKGKLHFQKPSVQDELWTYFDLSTVGCVILEQLEHYIRGDVKWSVVVKQPLSVGVFFSLESPDQFQKFKVFQFSSRFIRLTAYI